jgi:hypothetical protein
MASAEEYAKWIVENADKKGTPEFETVAQAYQLAKDQPATAPQEPSKEYSFKDAMAGSALAAGRGLMTGGPLGMATGMIGEGNRQIDKAAYSTGGKVTDLTGSPEMGFVANVGMQAIPAVLGGEAVKAMASPAFESAAKGLMSSALKASGQARASGDAAKAIDTILKEGVNVSPSGNAQLRTLIDKLHGEVAEKIAAAPTATVDKSRVAREVFGTLKKFQEQVNKRSDVKQILASWKEFSDDFASKIPVAEAQKVKQGTYRVLADKYAKGGLPAIENEAATQAQMSMARGLREGIEEAVPGVGPLNARESALINALELSEKRVGVAGNRDLGGIAWLANNPQAAAAMMADRSSAFKSWLANRIYQYRRAIPQAAGSSAAGMYEASTQNP